MAAGARLTLAKPSDRMILRRRNFPGGHDFPGNILLPVDNEDNTPAPVEFTAPAVNIALSESGRWRSDHVHLVHRRIGLRRTPAELDQAPGVLLRVSR
jgi:hypothetical protein